MKTLLIEGWRGINHSFALVNQHQLLQLAEQADFKIYHRDMPFPDPAWKKTMSGFDADDEATINAFGPPGNAAIDVIYRLDFPFRLYGGAAKRIFVFATSELGSIPANFIDREPASKYALANNNFEIIAPSRWSAEGIRSTGYDCPIHVVPHGVDPDLYWPAAADEKRALRRRFALPEHAFVFLNIGAMMWNKGAVELLCAFAAHRAAFPDSHLVLKSTDFLYGGHVDQAVRSAIGRRGSEVTAALSSVHILRDNLSHDELACLYRACDAYVSPYLAEGFNLPVLEAIASGLPVLVTAGGPTDDFCDESFTLKIASTIVDTGNKHYLKPDLDSAVAQMARVVNDRALREAAAVAGPERVRERYSWRAVTATLAGVLRA